MDLDCAIDTTATRRSSHSARAWIVALSLGLYSFQALGQSEDLAERFRASLAEYQAAVAKQDWDAALPAAERAYESGRQQFGARSRNTAALARNYSLLVANTAHDPDRAIALLREARAIYAEIDGPASVDQLDVLLSMASVQSDYADRAASLASAIEMQRVVAPDDRIAHARIQTTAAQKLLDLGAERALAKSWLEEALDTLTAAHGRRSPELLTTLIALGDASAVYADSAAQLRHYRRAIAIVEETDASNLERIADMKFRAGGQILRLSQTNDATRLLKDAYEMYGQILGAQHEKTAIAAMTVAQALANWTYAGDEAEYLLAAIDFYAGKPMYAAFLLHARRQLIALYDFRDDDDLTTEQILAIAQEASAEGDRDHLPVVKYAPAYPLQAASTGAEGYVIIEFTIDESGYVIDPVVIESASERGQGVWFHEPALAAARKFRYIPRLENGIPVATPGVRNKITFVLERTLDVDVGARIE